MKPARRCWRFGEPVIFGVTRRSDHGFHYKRHDCSPVRWRLVRGSYVNVKRLPELAPMTIDILFVSVTIHYPTSRASAIGQVDKASARDVQRVS